MLSTSKLRVSRPFTVTVTVALVLPVTFSRLASRSMGKVKVLVPTTLDKSTLPREISLRLSMSRSAPETIRDLGLIS